MTGVQEANSFIGPHRPIDRNHSRGCRSHLGHGHRSCRLFANETHQQQCNSLCGPSSSSQLDRDERESSFPKYPFFLYLVLSSLCSNEGRLGDEKSNGRFPMLFFIFLYLFVLPRPIFLLYRNYVFARDRLPLMCQSRFNVKHPLRGRR